MFINILINVLVCSSYSGHRPREATVSNTLKASQKKISSSIKTQTEIIQFRIDQLSLLKTELIEKQNREDRSHSSGSKRYITVRRLNDTVMAGIELVFVNFELWDEMDFINLRLLMYCEITTVPIYNSCRTQPSTLITIDSRSSLRL